MTVSHLFFQHEDNLRLVNLRWIHGTQLKEEFFQKWLDGYPDPYPQRYRRSIPFSWVKKNGILLMTLQSGEATYPVPVQAREMGGAP